MAEDKSKGKSIENLSDPVNRGMLNDAIDAILKGIDNLFLRFKKETDGVKTEIQKNGIEIQANQEEIKKNGLAISRLKNDFDGLLEEFSDTPSRKELNDLKTKVDHFHPTN